MSEEGDVTGGDDNPAAVQQTEQGGGNWKDLLPDEIREAPFIKEADTIEAAVDQITNAAGHMGNSIRIPSEDASDADLKQFYTRLAEKAPGVMVKPDQDNDDIMRAFYRSIGQPETHEGYRYEMPDGREMPADMENFAKIAHENGLTQKQFEGILGEVLKSTWEDADNQAVQMRDEMVTLAEEWGLAFEQRVGMVKNFLKMMDAPAGLQEMLAQNEMAPAEIKWIYQMASQMKSPTELADQPTGQDPDLISPQEARHRIEEIMNNKEHPYWKPTDPRNKDALRNMVRLQKLANPDSSSRFDDLRV